MPRLLSISNKLFSFRGQMSITDESNNLIYEAKGTFALFNPTWQLTKGEKQVATIKKKTFSWSPTWIVDSDLGLFRIKRKIWSWVRRYRVISGPFTGAEVCGNFWGLKFKITHLDQTIAQATGKIMTLRDRHNIEVLKDDPASELLTVIAMIILHMDKKAESESHVDS